MLDNGSGSCGGGDVGSGDRKHYRQRQQPPPEWRLTTYERQCTPHYPTKADSTSSSSSSSSSSSTTSSSSSSSSSSCCTKILIPSPPPIETLTELYCPLCKRLMRQVWTTDRCLHRFCARCVQQRLTQPNQQPNNNNNNDDEDINSQIVGKIKSEDVDDSDDGNMDDANNNNNRNHQLQLQHQKIMSRCPLKTCACVDVKFRRDTRFETLIRKLTPPPNHGSSASSSSMPKMINDNVNSSFLMSVFSGVGDDNNDHLDGGGSDFQSSSSLTKLKTTQLVEQAIRTLELEEEEEEEEEFDLYNDNYDRSIIEQFDQTLSTTIDEEICLTLRPVPGTRHPENVPSIRYLRVPPHTTVDHVLKFLSIRHTFANDDENDHLEQQQQQQQQHIKTSSTSTSSLLTTISPPSSTKTLTDPTPTPSTKPNPFTLYIAKSCGRYDPLIGKLTLLDIHQMHIQVQQNGGGGVKQSSSSKSSPPPSSMSSLANVNGILNDNGNSSNGGDQQQQQQQPKFDLLLYYAYNVQASIISPFDSMLGTTINSGNGTTTAITGNTGNNNSNRIGSSSLSLHHRSSPLPSPLLPPTPSNHTKSIGVGTTKNTSFASSSSMSPSLPSMLMPPPNFVPTPTPTATNLIRSKQTSPLPSKTSGTAAATTTINGNGGGGGIRW